MIVLKNINKTFKSAKREPGLKNAVKSFFSREYVTVHAINDLSFQIDDGEIVGYIGPNGAGKSTSIKIMSGILVPDSGECVINGFIPWRDRQEYVRQIGVVFGQRSQLWWDIPVNDSFELIKKIYDVDQKIYKRNIDTLVELLDVKEIIKTPVRQLSLGQRMRCEIIASLLHNPKILFLDEHSIGLDAVSKIAIRQFIQRINRTMNTTIVLTTHDMQDIEALAERVMLIGRGQLLFNGSISKLKNTVSSKKTVNIKYTGDFPTLCEGLTLKKKKDGLAELDLDTKFLSIKEAIATISSQTNLSDLSVIDITADEMVADLYKEYSV